MLKISSVWYAILPNIAGVARPLHAQIIACLLAMPTQFHSAYAIPDICAPIMSVVLEDSLRIITTKAYRWPASATKLQSM
jgi:hypothetical protein